MTVRVFPTHLLILVQWKCQARGGNNSALRFPRILAFPRGGFSLSLPSPRGIASCLLPLTPSLPASGQLRSREAGQVPPNPQTWPWKSQDLLKVGSGQRRLAFQNVLHICFLSPAHEPELHLRRPVPLSPLQGGHGGGDCAGNGSAWCKALRSGEGGEDLHPCMAAERRAVCDRGCQTAGSVGKNQTPGSLWWCSKLSHFVQCPAPHECSTLAALLLDQFPAHAEGMKNDPSAWDPAPTWETWVEFQASGSSPGQPWLAVATSMGNSLSLSV